MTTFTNLATGQVIGVVDGRDSTSVKTWLKTRPRWWRHLVRVVAIDPSAAFRSAVRSWLNTPSRFPARFRNRASATR